MKDFCPNCEDYRETAKKTAIETFNVRGMNIKISVSSECCVSCGEKMGSDKEDQQILDRVWAKYDEMREEDSYEEMMKDIYSEER